MFEPIFERHAVPTADRAALAEYFGEQNGIPESLRVYFLSRKWSRFIRECSIALTRRFLAVNSIQANEDDLTMYLKAFRHPELVEDMRQEVFALACEKPEPFSPTWMYELANRSAVSVIKADRVGRGLATA